MSNKKCQNLHFPCSHDNSINKGTNIHRELHKCVHMNEINIAHAQGVALN